MSAVGAGNRLSSESEGERRGRRPLSGGLWSMLAWLRGDEPSTSSSTDSLSSAGSARTAASFAFLAPPPPRARTNAPPLLQPPTDSYRRRLQDSNLRRQQDRDLTLHRKYGLYYGYDAFSLPHGSKNLGGFENSDRDRRAASESFPRRTAYVPGKRRAPLPPGKARPHSIASAATLTRRHSRKRPAPQPPATVIAKENREDETKKEKQLDNRLEMNEDSKRDRRLLADVNNKETNSDKCSTKYQNAKESKVRSEKSFLRQIFENKKRNSTIDPADRILPNISELDRRAAEIIESCKLKPLERNNYAANIINISREEAWFCTRCLRKYDSTVVTCQYCLPEQKRLSGFGFIGDNSTQTEKQETVNGPSTSRVSGVGSDDKQKLKEMLREMKESLPKRPKHEGGKGSPKMIYKFDSTGRNSSSFETETLRIGAKASKENNDANPVPSTSKSRVSDIKNIEQILPKIKPVPQMQNVIITRHVVLVEPKNGENSKPETTSGYKGHSQSSVSSSNKLNSEEKVAESASSTEIGINNVHTPLKISSLLNPVYVPKVNVTENQARRNFFLTKSETQSASTSNSTPLTSVTAKNPLSPNTSVTPASIVTVTPSASVENHRTQNIKLPQGLVQENSLEKSAPKPIVLSVTPNNKNNETTTDTKVKQINSNNEVISNVNQHSRRRDLINQLEQSIAKGDEKAAAEAAVKLAQLKLSCSVLSFTSQIMAGNSGATTSSSGNSAQLSKTEDTKKNSPSQQPNKVNVSVQSVVTAAPNKPARSKDLNAEITKSGINSKTLSTNRSNHKSNESPASQKPVTSTEPSTSKQITNDDKNTGSSETVIQVWVEDREATRGPLRLHIPRRAVMGDLRRQAETSLGLPGTLQRWIVGRALCTDDGVRLDTLAGPDLSAPFYLCVVEAEHGGANIKTETSTNVIKDPNKPRNNHASDVYSELVQLEQRAVVFNTEAFECAVCMEECPTGRGAILRECVHMFCRDCLSDLVRHSEEPAVTCPAMGCPGVLQEREIRALVSPEEYERWLARGLAAAETGTRNAFHCRTRDCTGWAFCDPEVQKFPCPVCKHTNCIPCQSIHEGETCEQHLRRIQDDASDSAATAASTVQTDEGTRALLDTLIRKGEALECPECSAIITKKWGCDWIKCSACKTEICWVTRGRRWGPAGKGDTSGGCRCGVDGVRCHPSCAYCH